MKNRKIEKLGKAFFVLLIAIVLFNFSACIIPDSTNSNLIERLNKCKYVYVDFNADIQSNSDFLSFSILTADNNPVEPTDNCELEWNGSIFNANFDYSYTMFSGENVRTYGEITGTLSSDGEMVESLVIKETSLYLDSGDVFKDFINVKNVPYNAEYEYDSYTPRFSVEGSEVINHIYSYSQSWEFQDSDGNTQTIYATEVIYNNPDDVPYLHITFSED